MSCRLIINLRRWVQMQGRVYRGWMQSCRCKGHPVLWKRFVLKQASSECKLVQSMQPFESKNPIKRRRSESENKKATVRCN